MKEREAAASQGGRWGRRGSTWNRTGKVLEMAPPNSGRPAHLSPDILRSSGARDQTKKSVEEVGGGDWRGGGGRWAWRLGQRFIGKVGEVAARRSHARRPRFGFPSPALRGCYAERFGSAGCSTAAQAGDEATSGDARRPGRAGEASGPSHAAAGIQLLPAKNLGTKPPISHSHVALGRKNIGRLDVVVDH